jgi:hypothetical protein
MAQNEQKNSLLSKLALIVLALSFPVGLFLLNAPAFRELVPATDKKDIALDLDEVIEAKSEEIAKIDLQILEAKGQLLKFEEMKGSQLRELKTLYNRIAKMLEGSEPSLDRPSEGSK